MIVQFFFDNMIVLILVIGICNFSTVQVIVNSL